MSHIIANANKPCLVLCHNKTLAAQLARELRAFLSMNSVEFFVSYYNHYTPESYIETTGRYIAKKSSINAEIDALRHRATRALLTRPDVVVVASVSCIYGLGLPEEYINASEDIFVEQIVDWNEFINGIHRMCYELNDDDEEFGRGKYQISMESNDKKVLVLWPPHAKFPIQIQLERSSDQNQDSLFRISRLSEGTQSGFDDQSQIRLFPARHHVTSGDRLEQACLAIEEELDTRLKELKSEGKTVEADRLQKRVLNDVFMLRETGFCSGGENYSRHFAGREAGMAPSTFIDFIGNDYTKFQPRDWLLIVDESHVTVPQLSAMYAGDQARKHKLVKHGYRLPSALDNRPLKSSEFWDRVQQTVFVSATPSAYERSLAVGEPVEMIIRPTFVCDPEIELRPTAGQLEDFLKESQRLVSVGSRGLVTTLTKRDAEDLSSYLNDHGVNSTYIHSSVSTHERSNALKALQRGDIAVLVGVNLLREGLDLPQVSLVAIFNADAEGFLRCETSLLQTVGRAARNINGRAIFYANRTTNSMKKCIDVTKHRREKQIQYNNENNCIVKSTKGSSVLSIFDLLKDKIESEVSSYPSKAADSSRQLNKSTGESIEPVSISFKQSDKKQTFVTDHIPTDPGVYFWKDSEGSILYIGKALKLRSRVKSYLSPNANHSRRIRLMLQRAAAVQFIITPSDRDALVLESNLIKHHQPPFNVLLKDDEHYPYICASIGDQIPRLSVVPQKHDTTLSTKDYRYFGPYTSMKEINAILTRVEEQYNLRSQAFLVRHGSLPKEDYHSTFNKMIEESFDKQFTNQDIGTENDELIRLRSLYEEAGLLFDSEFNRCKDVIGFAHADSAGRAVQSFVVVVIQLRDGIVAGSYTYECTAPFVTVVDAEDFSDIIHTVLLERHYPSAPSGGPFSWFPDEILIPCELYKKKEFETDIKKVCKLTTASHPRGKSNSILVTAIDVTTRLDDSNEKQQSDIRTLGFASKNAVHIATNRVDTGIHIGAEVLYDGTAPHELAGILSMKQSPVRIECFVSDRLTTEPEHFARHLTEHFFIRISVILKDGTLWHPELFLLTGDQHGIFIDCLIFVTRTAEMITQAWNRYWNEDSEDFIARRGAAKTCQPLVLRKLGLVQILLSLMVGRVS
jgi:excinuclease ABC subunit B